MVNKDLQRERHYSLNSETDQHEKYKA